MDLQEFIKKRNELLAKKKQQETEINDLYTKYVFDFIEKNSPVKKLTVYELVENGIRRRGFKRFVIYTQEVIFFDSSSPIIRVGGWWLNTENIPTKWDTMTVSGIGNPAIFKMSENQINLDHPDKDLE